MHVSPMACTWPPPAPGVTAAGLRRCPPSLQCLAPDASGPCRHPPDRQQSLQVSQQPRGPAAAVGHPVEVPVARVAHALPLGLSLSLQPSPPQRSSQRSAHVGELGVAPQQGPGVGGGTGRSVGCHGVWGCGGCGRQGVQDGKGVQGGWWQGCPGFGKQTTRAPHCERKDTAATAASATRATRDTPGLPAPSHLLHQPAHG